MNVALMSEPTGGAKRQRRRFRTRVRQTAFWLYFEWMSEHILGCCFAGVFLFRPLTSDL